MMTDLGAFIELTIYGTDNKVLVRKSEIKTVYTSGKAVITSIVVGNREFDVNESYEEVRGMLVPPDVIQIKYSEEDKKRIEKFMEEWQAYPVIPLTFGMTDDEWHRAIAGFSD